MEMLFILIGTKKTVRVGSLARYDSWFGFKLVVLFNEKSGDREFESRPAHQILERLFLA